LSLKSNKFFIRLFSCFLAIIFVFSLTLLLVKFNAFEERKEAAVENLNIEFINDSENMGQMFSQLRAALHEVSVEISADVRFENNSYIDKNDIRSAMKSILVDRHQSEFSSFLSAVFVVDDRNPNVIYEYTGTYSDKEFFSKFSGTEYREDFWIEKAKGNSVFEMLKATEFSIEGETMQRTKCDLLPIVFKPRSESTYAIVALLDIEEVAGEFGVSCILSEENVPLYVGDGISEKVITEAVRIEGNAELSADEKGYIFKMIDTDNENIRIVKLLSEKELSDAVKFSLGGDLVVPVLVIFSMVIVAFALAYAYAKKFTKLSDVVFENMSETEREKKAVRSIDELVDAVKLLASHNIRSSAEVKPMDSVLDSMLLQSRMRDVYVGIDDIEKNVDISRAFFMIYLRVNYKEEFEDYIGKDSGKATFLLKQLIEMYLKTWDINATTFQIEKNGIVSVFDIKEGFSGEKEVVDSLVAKLSNESEYAFFTIAVSRSYDGMENIKSVYDALIDLSKYSKPIAETQILFEEDVQLSASRFYFSVEEMGRLSAILQNGNEEEALRAVDEILEYNIKKDINCFELYLLSTEIINCAVKLVNRKLHAIPQNIRLSDVYKDLERAHTPSEYRRVCGDFLAEVMLMIRENKREDDYIISYILEYIDNHYAEDIYLNLFAEKLKLTAAYISSYFKEKMNVNLSDYLNNYRIKKAVELSENPQNKNKDIAVMVGLPNINTFIRLFKKYTGYTPGEYRKKHYGDDCKK